MNENIPMDPVKEQKIRKLAETNIVVKALLDSGKEYWEWPKHLVKQLEERLENIK